MHRLIGRMAAPLAAGTLLLALAGCYEHPPETEFANREIDPASIGNVSEGRVKLVEGGCATCHVIPGIREAQGLVGPPLTHWANRIYIVGLLHNTPENTVTWIQHPQKIVPGNAMPDLGIPDKAAHDITAYLYTIR